MQLEKLKEKIGLILDVTLERAKINRAQIPYSKVDAFPNAIILLGPSFEVAATPVTWRNEAEKYARMRVVSQTAKETLSMAVILVTDTRFTEADKVAPLMGLPKLDDVGLEKWSELYKQEMHKRFKGYAGNMPAEWYSEAIMVVAKGPGIGIITRSAEYEKGENDSIKWVTRHTSLQAQHFNLLPDWWC